MPTSTRRGGAYPIGRGSADIASSVLPDDLPGQCSFDRDQGYCTKRRLALRSKVRSGGPRIGAGGEQCHQVARLDGHC